MTLPLGFPDPTPNQRSNWLGRYVAVEKKFDSRLRSVLLDALSGIDEAFANLGDNFSDQVRRQQLSLSNSAIRETIHGIFGATGNLVREYRQDAAVAAVEAQLYDQRGILARLFPETVTRRQYAESLRQSARRNIDSVVTRVLESEKPLSQRVYRSEAWANGQVSQAINRALARGDSAKNLADSVKHLVNPDVPGGVSYASRRLGRTEINNAFHAQAIHDSRETPWVDQMQWNLSDRHEVPDECNEYALIKFFDVESVPEKPHPQCWCYVTPKMPDYNSFENNLLTGQYDDYLDSVLDASIEEQPRVAEEFTPSEKLQVEIDKAGPGKEIYPWSGISPSQRKELQRYNSQLQAEKLAKEAPPPEKPKLSTKKKKDATVPESIDAATNSTQVGNWLTANYEGLEVSGFDYEAIDPRSAKEVAQAFVDQHRKIPGTNLNRLTVKKIPESKGGTTNAMTVFNGKTSEIQFNLEGMANYEDFQKEQKAKIESGYFAERKNAENPWRSTFIHEYGHVLDYSSGRVVSRSIDPISDRAWAARRKGEKERKVTNYLFDAFDPDESLDPTDPKTLARYDKWFLDNIPSGYSFKDSVAQELYPEETVAEAFSDAVETTPENVSPVSKALVRKLLAELRRRNAAGKIIVPISKVE